MPFRSKAQQRFMFAAEARGEIPKGTARRWAHETPDIKNLPERVHKKESAAYLAGVEAAFSEFLKEARLRLLQQSSKILPYVKRQGEAIVKNPKAYDIYSRPPELQKLFQQAERWVDRPPVQNVPFWRQIFSFAR